MSLPETFKAFVIEAEGQKPLLKDIPLPKPGKNQVIVKMEFSPINPADLDTMAGDYPVTGNPPYGIGKEGSGTIAALGEDLKVPYQIGDRVHVLGPGTFGKYLVTESEECAKVQEGLGMELAACHHVNPFTVHFMGYVAQKGGHKAAIHTAGSSTVGRMLIRYFKHIGIKLINIVRRDDVIPELEKEGADYVLNSTKPDFEKTLSEIAQSEGVTICFEALAGEMSGIVLRNMPDDTTMHIYGTLSNGKINDVGADDFILKNKAIKGLKLTRYINELTLKESSKRFVMKFFHFYQLC